MTRERAKRLAAKWAKGHVCSLREGEAEEYHKMFYDLLCKEEERTNTKPIIHPYNFGIGVEVYDYQNETLRKD